MRHVIVPAVAAVLLASTSVAMADLTAFGTVKALDMQSMTLTLDDGSMFSLPAEWSNPGLIPGVQVTVIYESQYQDLDEILAARQVLIDLGDDDTE